MKQLNQAPRCAHLKLNHITLAVLSALAASGVQAQSVVTQLEPVIVQATKIEEPLLGSPNSITVMSGDYVENNQIRAVEDLSKFTPNLKLDSAYGAGTRGFLSIRGVGNTPGSMDPSASIYLDDVPYHDFMTYAQPLFDVKQVEILRGPQGTLYGGFAQAGVIDIRSNLPGRETKRSASLDLYSPQNARTIFSVAGPVSEVLSVGLSVLDERGESFIKNVTLGKRSDREQNAVRLQGVLRPDPDTEALLTVLHHRQRNDGGADYLPVSRSTYNTHAGVNTSKFEIANNIEGYQNLDTDAQSLRLKKRASGVEYTLVAANRQSNVHSLTDFNYIPGNSGLYASESDDKITNQYGEVRARFLPKASDFADVTVGYSWMKQTYDVYNTIQLSSTTYDVIKANGENQSLFANGRLPLNKEGLSLVSGLRYEQAERYGVNTGCRYSSFSSSCVAGISPTEKDSSQVTWKLGMSKVLSSGADFYANAATGWRPAAVNYYANSSWQRPTVGKEKSITYEAGYRHAKDSQYLSAAVFLTKVDDYQETRNGAIGTAYLANVAKVDIPGFEVEVRQAISKSTRLLAGLGFSRARYDSYPESPSLEGKAPGNRPDWNFHVGTEYVAGPVTYGVTVLGTDSFNSAYNYLGTTTKVDGHLIANLRATYAQKNYSVTAFINNVADKEYFLNAYYDYYDVGFNPQTRGQVGSPRTIGVSVKANF